MAERKIVVCRTHFVDARLLAFARSVHGRHGYHVAFAVDETRGPVETFEFEKIPLTREAFAPLELFTEIGDIFWRCGDYALYLARLRHPGCDTFWLVEYDVTINHAEPVRFLLDLDESHDHDLLSTHFRRAEDWWSFGYPMRARGNDVFRSYFPLVRLSGRALDHAMAERVRDTREIRRLPAEQRPEWPNDEAFIATVLQNGGFRCADFNDLGRHYTDRTFWMTVLVHPTRLPLHDGLLYHAVRTGQQYLKIVRHRDCIDPLPEPSELFRLAGVDWTLEEMGHALKEVIRAGLDGVGDNPGRVMAADGVIARVLEQNSAPPVLRAVVDALAQSRMPDCLDVLRGWRVARWWPDLPELDNVALARPAWQSSVSQWSTPPDARGDAQGGNDGRLDVEFGFHTAAEPQPWWSVDLMEPHRISRVRIHNRRDHAERMNGFRLLASLDRRAWQVIHRSPDDIDFAGTADRPIEIELSARARFLRLQIPGTHYLHFREFEAFGVACG